MRQPARSHAPGRDREGSGPWPSRVRETDPTERDNRRVMLRGFGFGDGAGSGRRKRIRRSGFWGRAGLAAALMAAGCGGGDAPQAEPAAVESPATTAASAAAAPTTAAPAPTTPTAAPTTAASTATAPTTAAPAEPEPAEPEPEEPATTEPVVEPEPVESEPAEPEPEEPATTEPVVEPEPEEPATTEPVVEPEPTPLECAARAPLEAAVGQIVLALTLQSEIADIAQPLTEGRLGGLVLVGDIDTEIGDLLAPFSAVQPPPLIAADEEGGLVQRLEAILGDQPSARDVGDTGDPNVALEMGRTRAEGAAGLGVNLILAPVLDVGNSASLVSRSYGDDADKVIRFGWAYATGLMEGGTPAVVKHFPGHGSTHVDSHLKLPVTLPLDELREIHLVPFAEAVNRGIPAVMTSHLDVPGLTEEGEPVTFSPPAVALLREELGFDGVIMSDALNMGALAPLTAADAAEAAMIAGHDLLIAGHPDDALASAARLVDAVTADRIDRTQIDESLVRVLGLKDVDPCTVTW